jgi:phenylpropionate dioxygenase-like ring-hydroxylating dioxygenase large terminal subunit
MVAETDPARTHASAVPDLPALGHRNYWYPIVESNRVGRHPVSVRVLGEDIVLFRSGGTLGALADRCPHRGAQLSRGRLLFPGTLSCGYHGWTFNSRGECLAAIVEGPESKIPGKVRIKAYPLEERFGVIWVFIGEGESPPLDEDLPPELKEPHARPAFAFEDWRCNWRLVTENFADMCHAAYVHRTSIIMAFRKVPAFSRMTTEELPDGQGFNLRAAGGGLQAEYPGLGKFPAHLWWRVIGGRKGPPPAAHLRMPGYLALRMQEAVFGVSHVNVGWPVPIDEHHTRYVNLIVTYPDNAARRVAYKAWFRGYYRPLHSRLVGQDKHLLESQAYRDPEKLSVTDTGLIQWRRVAPKLARQARLAGLGGGTPPFTGAEPRVVDSVPGQHYTPSRRG